VRRDFAVKLRSSSSQRIKAFVAGKQELFTSLLNSYCVLKNIPF
jgi:hypothetical protein